MFVIITLMKRLENSILVILIVSLFSCESAKDYTAKVANASISPTGGAFEISLEGKSRRHFEGRIIVDGTEVNTFEVASSPYPEFYQVTFDIKKIVDLAAFDTLISFNNLPVKIVLLNKAREIRIDTIINFPFRRPPVVTSFRIIEPEQLRGVVNLFSEADFIRNLVRNGGHVIDNPKTKLLPTIFTDTTQTVKVSLEIDSTYHKTVIGRWPSIKNRFYNRPDIESVMIESAKRYESIENESRKNIVEKSVKMRFSGLNDIFLISFRNRDEFVIIKLFEAAVDNIGPVFSDYSRSFDGDPEIEGHVFLRSEKFYGYNPYRVPFTGFVHGDIKQILIEGVPIQFTVGEDIYAKRTLDLDNGYNRVDVTVIDKRGNRTKGFIEITIERMTDEQVKIENNIDIDNN